jgi:hypothetical protein
MTDDFDTKRDHAILEERREAVFPHLVGDQPVGEAIDDLVDFGHNRAVRLRASAAAACARSLDELQETFYARALGGDVQSTALIASSTILRTAVCGTWSPNMTPRRSMIFVAGADQHRTNRRGAQ